MRLKLKQTPGIFLVGFMGCGKSTVGRALADELGWRFIDLDEEIEKHQGTTIAHIFDTMGEPEFRRIESELLTKQIRLVSTGQPRVVALGGGAFLNEANFQAVAGHGVSLWLDCPLEMLERRVAGQLHRPLARDPERFRSLFEARRPGYQRADYQIIVEGDDSAVTVAKIMALPLLSEV